MPNEKLDEIKRQQSYVVRERFNNKRNSKNLNETISKKFKNNSQSK